MSEHDINGGSQIDKREACPGSARLEAQCPSKDSPDSERGRKLHAILYECLLAGEPPSPDDVDGMEDESNDLADLTYCYDFAQAAMSHEKATSDSVLVLLEHYLDLSFLGIDKGGTVDLALVEPGGGFYLIDWKFGINPARAPFYNRQLQTYACGLAAEFGCTHGVASIVQPALVESMQVREAVYTPSALAEYRDRISYIVKRARDPGAPLIPGSHCTRCRAVSSCEARRSMAQATIAQMPVPAINLLNDLPPENRGHAYERLKLAKAWAEGACEEIDRAIIEGRLQVPGYVVGEGRRGRQWLSEIDAERVLTEHLGERAHMRKLLSPAQVEGVMGKRAAADVLKGLTVQTVGKPRVMRDGSGGLIDE